MCTYMSRANPGRTISRSGALAFVRGHTRLRAVPGLTGMRLYSGGDIMALYDQTVLATGQADVPLPYWAYAWSGGLAVAQHLVSHPEAVRGQRVLDVASGSGLCAIAAVRAGALQVTAIDVDPLAAAAIELNAIANHVQVAVLTGDLLDQSTSGWDVVLAGDICYEAAMTERFLGWLRRASRGGSKALVGDPGRRYLPGDLVPLAAYSVRASMLVEESGHKQARVFRLAD